MSTPNLILLYVKDPLLSAEFYQNLFEQAPEGKSPTYVSFGFANGLHIGLWSTSAKNFVSGGAGNLTEIAFMLKSEQEVNALHDKWQKQGVTIEQPPHNAVFGLTFVAIDPDGHRIRVCLPDS